MVALSACGGGGNEAQPPADQQPAQETPAADKPAEETPAGGNAAYDAAAAETSYKNTCASCHGQNLEGVVGPNLAKIGTKYSKEQILDIIVKGKGGMPPGLLAGNDADAVASWLADKK